jgi:hypothetical protein
MREMMHLVPAFEALAISFLFGAWLTTRLCRFEKRVTMDVIRKTCEELGGSGNCPDCQTCALPPLLHKITEMRGFA